VVEDRGRATEALLRDRAREQQEEQERDRPRQEALAAMRERRRRQMEVYNLDNEFPPPPPPPPAADAPGPPPRARINLGGAVLRRGNHRIEYRPGRPAAPPARQDFDYMDAEVLANQYQAANERLQPRRGLQRVQAAQDAQVARHPEMIAAVMQNLMGHGDQERMEALYARLRPAGIHGFQHHHLHHHPGGQQPLEDASVITARQRMPEPLELVEGFTSDFDLNDTIEIDQPKHAKRYLACTRCGDPLYLNDGQKTPSDRVWGLRCGHLLDQKCLLEISAPQEDKDRMNVIRPPPGGLDILGDEDVKSKKTRGSKRKSTKKTVPEPVEYEWKCPVKGCGWKHISVLQEAEWKQDEEEGAVQLYV
jgi:hypothetical protein